MMVAVGFSPRNRSKPKFNASRSDARFHPARSWRGQRAQGGSSIKTFSLCFRDGFTGVGERHHGSQRRRRRAMGKDASSDAPSFPYSSPARRNASPLKPSRYN